MVPLSSRPTSLLLIECLLQSSSSGMTAAPPPPLVEHGALALPPALGFQTEADLRSLAKASFTMQSAWPTTLLCVELRHRSFDLWASAYAHRGCMQQKGLQA